MERDFNNNFVPPYMDYGSLNNANEITMKEIAIEGLLSIQAGENPRVIEEKLKSFLAPADRASDSAEGGEEVG